MLAWYQRLAAIVSAIALAAIGELVGKYVTGGFDALRLVVLVVVTQALAVGLLALLQRTPRQRLVLDFVFFSIGVAATALGVMFTVSPGTATTVQVTTMRLALIGLGLVESTLAGYAIYIGLTGRDVDFLPLLDLGTREPERSARGQERVAVTKLGTLRDEHREVLEKVVRHLSTEDLHYVAYYVDNRCLFLADVLDDPRLNRFFQELDRPTRRAQYERHGRQIIWLTGALDRSLRHIQGGMLIRTVLDIQYGALYHFPVAVGVHLVGVTLIQERVPEADEKLAALKDALSELPRGGRLSARPLEESRYYRSSETRPAPTGTSAKAAPLSRAAARRRRPAWLVTHSPPAPHGPQ